MNVYKDKSEMYTKRQQAYGRKNAMYSIISLHQNSEEIDLKKTHIYIYINKLPIRNELLKHKQIYVYIILQTYVIYKIQTK